MKAKEYNNEFLRQIRTAPETVAAMGETMTEEVLRSAIPDEAIKRTNRVILTGCGDSYCAAIAAKPTFENVESSTSTGMVPGTRTEAERCIEFTRYYDTYRRFWLSGENRVVPLVCGVSISGAVKRVTEAMLRGNKYGAETVAFTDNFASEFAKAAKHVVALNVPPNKMCPNVTSYVCSSFALSHLGLHYSTVRGQMKQEDARRQREAMQQYAKEFTPELMAKIEERCLAISQKWLDDGIDNMDFIGDGPDYATAYFGAAKMVESFGGLTTYDDSEDWNHINYFIRTPEKVGTFVIANSSSPSFKRVQATIETAVAIGRPVVVITDIDSSYFPEEAEVFTLPQPEYKWCNPILQHIPMDYVAAFTGLLLNIPDFRPDSPLHQLDAGAKRFRESEVVIV